MKALALALALMAEGSGEWQTHDTILEATFVTLVLVDWCQTTSFLYHQGAEESNPLLGKHPTRLRLNLTVPVAILAHAGIAYLLPKGWLRTGWQAVWIGLEGNVVARNFQLGAGLSFPWD